MLLNVEGRYAAIQRWRSEHPFPEGLDLNRAGFGAPGRSLATARLGGVDLRCADVRGADLIAADLSNADLRDADLRGACLRESYLRNANFGGADLRDADCSHADLTMANLTGAKLRGADFSFANMFANDDLAGADLFEGKFGGARLGGVNFSGCDLRGADLSAADLSFADLSDAKLIGANLTGALLIRSNFQRADLSGSRVYGVAAWDVDMAGAHQTDLIVTPPREAVVTVDEIQVAQLVYLLLSNSNIRRVIDTIGKRGVLILGRFTEGRKALLEAIRSALRQRGYLPVVFDFERPTGRDLTETVMVLAGMCRFIIADITKPRSVPLELEATVPNYMIPFVPILESGEEPFSMFVDLWRKHREWVLDPLRYDSADRLIELFDAAVLEPALQRCDALEKKKAQSLITRDL